MTTDERLDRLAERVDAIVQSLELEVSLRKDLEEQMEKRRKEFEARMEQIRIEIRVEMAARSDELHFALAQTLAHMNRLEEVVRGHETRIQRLENQ